MASSLFSTTPPTLSRKPVRLSTPLKRTPAHLSFSPLKTSTKPCRFSRVVVSLFTGIVEEIGQIEQLGSENSEGVSMKIGAKTVIDRTQLGDSIAVNGTCLTVTEIDTRGSFSVGLSPETLRRTSLGGLGPGSPVNLERALTPESRMGGHFVQGHVDDTGEIVNFEPEGDSLWVKVKVSPDLLRLIVPKGFIAVDGTSLTVVRVYESESCFDFMLVAYTQQKVVIPMKKVGDRVNLEVDILGKYVEKFLSGRMESLNLGPTWSNE